jgi:hypothetical protein
LAIAIKAPVFPAETTLSASPAATALRASLMLDVRPCRRAKEGFMQGEMTSGAWRNSLHDFKEGLAASKGAIFSSSPKKMNLISG